MPKKNDTLYYLTGKNRVRSRVKTAHRDGSVTVHAMFFLDIKGADSGPYLGFNFRIDPRITRVFDAAGRQVG